MFDCVYSTLSSLPLYKKHNGDDVHQNCSNMFRIKRDPSSTSFILCLAEITVMVLSCPLICCYNTDYVHTKGHDRTVTLISAKHFIKLPDDGSLVIRNMLEQF